MSDNNPDRIDLPDEEVRILEGGIICHVKRIGRPSAKVMRECMERIAPWLEQQKALQAAKGEQPSAAHSTQYLKKSGGMKG